MKRLEVTPADLHAVARLIRRYESGVCAESQLTGRLREVLNALQALLVEWRPHLAGLRHRPSSELRDCDDAISAAQRLCRAAQFRQGLHQLKRARGVLAQLQALLDACEEHARAAEAFRELKALLDSQQLCQLLTVETIARLLEESDKLLASGRSRQAGFISRMCLSKSLALTEATASGADEDARKLSAAVARQAQFFRETEAFAPSPADSKLRRAFERLPELLSRGCVALVARLVADIECELASRRAVLASLGQAGGAAGQLTEELKRVVREESWEQAANHLLRRTLAALSSETTALRPVIGQITLRMEAAAVGVERPATQSAASPQVN